MEPVARMNRAMFNGQWLNLKVARNGSQVTGVKLWVFQTLRRRGMPTTVLQNAKEGQVNAQVVNLRFISQPRFQKPVG